jgi:hypothetical protein
MSEQILLLNRRRRKINPRRRRRHTNRRRRHNPMPAALARYWAGHPNRRRRRYSNRRRRHHYSNRRHHRRMNRRRYRSNRRYRRNPNFAGMLGGGRGFMRDYGTPVLIGGASGVLLDVAWGYATPYVPATFQTGWAGLLAKGAVLAAGMMILKRVFPRARAQIHTGAVGAATVLAYGAIKGAAQSALGTTVPGLSGYMDYHSYSLPGMRMHGYMPRTLGSLEDLYSPAAVIQPAGTAVPRQFGSYIARQPGMSGYMQPHTMGNGGLMGYDWSADGM